MDLSPGVINPLECPEWDGHVLSTRKPSFYHSSSWARVLSESYGFRPIYFTLLQGAELSSMLPVMGIRSVLTGPRGVSLPFTDSCEPIAARENHFSSLIANLIDYGVSAGWKYFELRGGSEFLGNIPSSNSFYKHTLDLCHEERVVFSHFRDSTRSTIRKTAKQGVEIKICHSLDSVKHFYVMNCMTRRRHGIPPQPFLFFESLFHHMVSRNQGMVVLAFYDGKVVAGAVFLHFGEEAIYKYSASDPQYRHLAATGLILWEAIKWYCRNGFKVIDFGRTELQNEGLRVFKRGFCRNEQVMGYYKYDLIQGKWREDHLTIEKSFTKLVRKLPIPILRIIGSFLYRHIG